jgi:hypothetical protein
MARRSVTDEPSHDDGHGNADEKVSHGQLQSLVLHAVDSPTALSKRWPGVVYPTNQAVTTATKNPMINFRRIMFSSPSSVAQCQPAAGWPPVGTGPVLFGVSAGFTSSCVGRLFCV